MCNILHIETAAEVCSVSIARNGEITEVKESAEEKSHAKTLAVFIEEILNKRENENESPDAVAISMGPGSYTGLRIGVSAAKGLCYGYNIPLISVPTLEAMNLGFQEFLTSQNIKTSENSLYSPMIDARRMEVYMALFSADNNYIKRTSAEIIEPHTFDDLLAKHSIYYFGSGAKKLTSVLTDTNAIFVDNYQHSSIHMAKIALEKYRNNEFADLAYFEPFYLKDFITTTSKKKYFH